MSKEKRLLTPAEALSYAAGGAMAILFPVGGPAEVLDPPEDLDNGYTLEQLRGWVGGYIEIVRLHPDISRMVVDDEGLIKGLPINVAATLLYRCYGGISNIHGPAVVVPWDTIT